MFPSGSAQITTAGSGTIPGSLIALSYGTTIATNASLGPYFEITVTDGVAFTMGAPTNGRIGDEINYTFKNTSGGAMGAITWNAAFALAGPFTNPATGNSRSIKFRRDGSLWREQSRNAADVPN